MSIHLARRDPITEPVIKSLRKEFLMLVGNVKRLKDPLTALRWHKAVAKWERHVYGLFGQIQDQIKGVLREDSGREVWNKQVHEGWAKHFLEKQKPIWNLTWELLNHEDVPDPENVRTGWGLTHEESVQLAFDRWYKSILKWDKRVRRRARLAWKWLNEFSEWTLRKGMYGGGGEALEWQVKTKENQVIEGFQFQLVGYEGEDSHKEGMATLKAGLAFYRQRASQVYSKLLQTQLPIELWFEGGTRDAAATYERSHITLGFWGINSQKRRFASIMAHEMGHHIYQTVLNQKQRDFWRNAVKGDFGPLDLRELLSRLRPGETIRQLEERIEATDPVLQLQLETLVYQPFYANLDMWSLGTIQEKLNEGLNPIVKVPATPITGYGGKSPEEAFCETLGLLVGYGPRTVLPKAKHWFSVLMPRVKMATSPTLRDKTIRLAYANPGPVRDALLPLLG